ncbi:PAS domain-containing sensor histidine kinase [Tellurirhabdus rosea]|uniref:PAS domain-containing sensor histidine kinase n=1 Tax=Tellurirhabdus rosea TaxID=2674997 RepID=UPI0022558875|nr:PAS domain-containing protein [Tellurirhabdus rosea]
MSTHLEVTSAFTPYGLLQQVLDSSLSGILILNSVRNEQGGLVDFEIALLNKVAAQHLNQPPDELLGRRIRQDFGARWDAFLPEQYEQVIRTKEAVQAEHCQTLPGRETADWLHVSITALGDGVTVAFEIITDLKEATLALQQQAQQYNEVLNSSANGIARYRCLYDEAGRPVDLLAVFINDKGVEISGIPRETHLSVPYSQIPRGQARQELLPWMLDVVQQGKTDARLIYAADIGFWFEMTATPHQPDLLTLTYSDVTEVQRLRLEASAQANFLESIFENLGAGQVLFRPVRDQAGQIIDFRYLLTNKANAEYVGMSPTAMQGRLMSELFPESMHTDLFDKLCEVADRGQSLRHIQHYRYDNVNAWLDYSISRYGSDVLFSFLDVTEIKQLQLAQQEQAGLLQSVIDNSPNGIVLIEAIRDERGIIQDFRYLLSNNTNNAALGLSPEAVYQQSVKTLQPGIRQTDLFRQLVEVTETGLSQTTLLHFGEPPEEGWFDCSMTRQGDGVLFMFQDVTEQKKMERAIRSQANLLQGILDVAPVHIIVSQAIRNEQNQIVDFRHVLVNSQICEWSGVPVEEFYRQTALEMRMAYPDPESFAADVQMVETGEPLHTQFEYNGRWVDMQKVKFDDGFIAAGIDITQLQIYRQTLETRNRDLERTNENLRQFAYVASHDLQEPLRKLQSFGDLLEGQFKDELGETGQDLIARMQSAARRMSSLIHDLLMFSRVSNNELVLKQTDLNAVAGDVLHTLEFQLEESGGTVHFEPLPTVTGDRMQLQQLIQNLISNAIKFRRPGHPPRIQIRHQLVLGEILPAHLSPARKYHQIEVEDNGIGFDEKYLDRIFQIFQRLHGKTNFTGTGIGLAICKRVVENHHGHLTARSQPDQGATFTVYLPAETD